LWRSALDDFWWADRFGWTPSQVGGQDVERLARLRHVAVAIDEGRDKRAKEDARASGG
jgi:hypothetical protein